MTMEATTTKADVLLKMNPDEREAQIDRILSMADSPQRRALEPKDFSEGMQLAKVYAAAGLYGVSDPNMAFVILQTGRELGLMAGQSFRALYVVDGKPALYAAAKVALARRSGLCTKWNVIESTAATCTIEVQRNGDPPAKFVWTRERADAIYLDKDRKQKLTDKAVWKNFPTQMLRHRCESEAVDALFQDCTLGLATVEELIHDVGGAPPKSETVDLEPKPAAVTTDVAAPWRARFAAVKTQAELDKLVTEVPKELRASLKGDLAAAKTRLGAKPPTDDGPKGGAPKPEAPTNTEAVGEREPGSDDDSTAPNAWTPTRWAAHLERHSSPHAVLNSHAKHAHEFMVADEYVRVTVARLVALGYSAMQAVNTVTARVATRKAA